MFGKPSSYIDIDGIKKQLEDAQREVDLMILHEDKGIIFIQVTRTYYFSFLSFAPSQGLVRSAGRMELSSWRGPVVAEDRRP